MQFHFLVTFDDGQEQPESGAIIAAALEEMLRSVTSDILSRPAEVQEITKHTFGSVISKKEVRESGR